MASKSENFLTFGSTLISPALNFDLQGSSASGMQDQTYKWQDEDAYLSGLEVFHSLHCLNMIRRALHPDYYRLMHDSKQPTMDIHIGMVAIQLTLKFVR